MYDPEAAIEIAGCGSFYHFVMAVPLIAVGRYSVEIDSPMILLFLAILVAGYLLLNRLRKKGIVPDIHKRSAGSKR